VLQGLLPAYRHNDVGTCTLRLIGAGLSDYLDLLVRPPRERDVLAALAATLQQRDADWDTVEFQQLPVDSPLVTSFSSGELVPAEPCLVVDLTAVHGAPVDADEVDESWRAVEGIASAGLRTHLAQDWRRLTREYGGVRAAPIAAERIVQWLPELKRLHTARWQTRGERGVLDDEAVWRFHRLAAPRLAGAGIVRMYTISAGGDVAGIYYGFMHRHRAYYYLGGFEPAYGKCGVGNLAVGTAIAEARREGAIAFDFLRGAEPYKRRWGATDRQNLTRRISPKCSTGGDAEIAGIRGQSAVCGRSFPAVTGL
jgi:CelD/BcsL family acetyltransferase involved in cellulose biosynthesis